MLKKMSRKFLLIASIFASVVALSTYIYIHPHEEASLNIATTSFPGITHYETPQSLTITFQNTADTRNKEYQKQINSPIAPLDMINKEVSKGITLSPPLSGVWRWTSENTLTFTPKQDWPANQDFVVRLDQSLFDTNALQLATNTLEWVTPYFEANIESIYLEQDVAGGKDHNIFATITFTHPVDKSTLAKHLKLLDKAAAQEIPYELTYEPDLKTAYLRSSTISITDKERYLTLLLAQDVQTTLGKASLHEAKESKKLIPDIYSFLKLDQADYSIVTNKDGNPEQIFHIALTDALTYEEFSKHVTIAVDIRDKAFRDSLKENDPIYNVKILPIQGVSSKDFFLKSEIPTYGYVNITLLKGMQSVNGFELRRDIKESRSIPSYPRELKIMGEGSVLALSGEKRVSFAIRGISGLKVTVQKLQDEQINHLISQTNGDITSPEFKSYSFNADNITDKELQEFIPLAATHPKDQNYASLDLSKYLRNQGSGIFFIQAEDYNIQKQTRDYYLSDKRLIIITDMGLVVKKANDGSRDVFVASISSGKPVSGAKVSVLGKNGQAISSKITSSDGKVSFYNLDSYKRAQTPTVIVVTKDNDLSFIPYEEYSRTLNYSQFDVGGVSSFETDKARELSAYAFSDRGIYRPGENVHLAAIVRQGNLTLQKGIVVRGKIYDAQNKIV